MTLVSGKETSSLKEYYHWHHRKEGEAFIPIFIPSVQCSGTQLCPALCDPKDSNPPGSSVHGILQARMLEWVAIFFSKFKGKSESEVTQSCLTLCDPMDGNLSDYSDHGISQARMLEWVAIFFSRGSSWPRDQTQVSCIAGKFFTIWATREIQEYWNG